MFPDISRAKSRIGPGCVALATVPKIFGRPLLGGGDVAGNPVNPNLKMKRPWMLFNSGSTSGGAAGRMTPLNTWPVRWAHSYLAI
jgi:hypothetical protein